MRGPLVTAARNRDGVERAARIQDGEAFLRLGETCPQEISGWLLGIRTGPSWRYSWA